MILPIHEVFYIEMLAYHVKTIIDNINRINSELNAMTGNSDNREFQNKADSLLNACQDIIGHSAAISRYFWPVRKDAIHRERGQKLREIYGVDDTNPLYNRDVRNSIEHFDEKLDIFMASFPSGIIYPSYVGSKAKAETGHIHSFRAYFVDSQIFRILDTEIHLSPIINEITRLQKLLGKHASAGFKFTYNANESDNDAS